jgi:hypothetical protein
VLFLALVGREIRLGPGDRVSAKFEVEPPI